MKIFLAKIFIILIGFYLLFQLTIGLTINNFKQKFILLTSKGQQQIYKEKILNEIKDANKKENIFSEEERVIISNFIKKIIKELKLE